MSFPLAIKAGRTALKSIRNNGFSLKNVRVVVAASGGAKWLALNRIDRALFPRLRAEAETPIYSLCSSIGSWRMSMLAQRDPVAAIQRFEDIYVDFNWQEGADAAEVNRVTRLMLEEVFGPGGPEEILSDPIMRTNILAVRARNLLASESRIPLMAGLLLTMGANAISRRWLQYFFERALFSDPRDLPPFYDMPDDTGIDLLNVELNVENYRDAVMATSSIPLVMEGVPNIAGAPQGMYRDGGFTDYHFDSMFLGNGGAKDEDIVLYPHYRERIIPGWFDKIWDKRGPTPAYYDHVVLIAPSDEFAASLPNGKIPDRGDFKRFSPNVRIAYWRAVLKETERLGDALEEILDKGDLGAYAVPLNTS